MDRLYKIVISGDRKRFKQFFIFTCFSHIKINELINGETVIHAAFRLGHHDIASSLFRIFKNKINLSIRDQRGKLALEYVTTEKSLQLVKEYSRILSNKIVNNSLKQFVGKQGHYQYYGHHKNAVFSLGRRKQFNNLRGAVNFSFSECSKYNELFLISVKYNNKSMIEKMLRKGIELEKKVIEKAIFHCICKGNLVMLKYLMFIFGKKKSINLNSMKLITSTSNQNRRRNDSIKKTYNGNVMNFNRLTPLVICRRKGNNKMTKLLKRYGMSEKQKKRKNDASVDFHVRQSRNMGKGLLVKRERGKKYFRQKFQCSVV